jgi:isopenicillin-N N-acyltransferase-like protein
MRKLELPTSASGRARGRIHGETFRGEIAALAEIRIYLCQKVGGMQSRAQVLKLAEAHLPVLERFDRELFDELCGIADGAAISPAEVVVLNHYTDLRDLGATSADPGGCTLLYARTPAGPVLAQTWDTHATSIPYVMMLRSPGPEGRPEAESWFLSVTGCLGMAGMTRGGVAVAINNLTSTDAVVGVVWSALVRKAVGMGSASRARDLILSSPVGSGHHYLVADRERAFGIETSGTLREVCYSGEEPVYVHTNHCLNGVVAKNSQVVPTSTTYDRYRSMSDEVAARPVADARDAFLRLGSDRGYPRSICTNLTTPDNPHGVATCAGLSMALASGELWAVAGFTHNVEPERFAF